ncbi:MAG: efflux RND transporter periplasmic adaptor subunit [Treponema sp.]|nr:efflux RND transporter periplasmic adaptor subunit [Treponema sp.]
MKFPKILQKTIIVCLAAAVFMFAACAKKTVSASYDFTPVARGTVERTVSASGTLNPVASVKVIPQMSGKVEKINFDYNDTVKKGQVLAELNTDMLKLQQQQQSASVAKAKANLDLQQINYNNQVALAQKNLISDYDLKTSKTTLDNQTADLEVAQSNLQVIETEINQYAFITSPIDGIVLDRKINVGDTVTDSSGSNSGAMFTLAENLKDMQIEAVVGELDIVSIHKGEPVRFSLESLPGRSFTGEVETLRMVPAVSNGVVSYTVIIKVENQDGSLLPGMTCNVDFIVESSENVLTVSNAALRYQPTTLTADKIDEMVFNAGLALMTDDQKKAAIAARDQANAEKQQAAQAQQQNAGGIQGLLGGGRANFRPGGQNQQQQGQGQNRGAAPSAVLRNLWYLDSEGKLAVMRVAIGITNGTLTEIRTNEDISGRQFILREKVNVGN